MSLENEMDRKRLIHGIDQLKAMLPETYGAEAAGLQQLITDRERLLIERDRLTLYSKNRGLPLLLVLVAIGAVITSIMYCYTYVAAERMRFEERRYLADTVLSTMNGTAYITEGRGSKSQVYKQSYSAVDKLQILKKMGVLPRDFEMPPIPPIRPYGLPGDTIKPPPTR